MQAVCEEVFPARLRAAIQSHEEPVTQQEVADAIDVSRRTLMTWLSGSSMPVSSALYRFCCWSGASADYLLGLHDENILYVEEG